MGEADDFLETESKKNEEEFLEKLKEGKNYDKVEKEYIEKSKKTKRIYEKKYNWELKHPKKEVKKEKKEEEKKEFIIERISLERTKKDIRRRERILKWFKFKRWLINFLRKKPFDFLRYIYFRLKIKKKNASQKLDDIKEKIKQRSSEIIKIIKDKSKQIFNKTKIIIKNITEKIKKVITTIKTKLKRKKEDKQEDDKKDSKESTVKTEKDK